eukprot:CAMPEP_0197548030 /NCGR_PEP_ID=MMETSP1320-20131121/2248_1 /TAXON_ID=91990 /ORGANISM="Bolidomonas sp., Strain RCC2347" /LENGTH=54 /DNA_ID=CAMNT_0043107955 /DNA_START=29 /DNA_END=193 /DNA_ORIENTATION=-
MTVLWREVGAPNASKAYGDTFTEASTRGTEDVSDGVRGPTESHPPVPPNAPSAN